MYKDNRHKLIWDFQKEIIEVYKENGLTNLAGLDREFQLNDRNILAWYYETIGNREGQRPDFDFNRCFEDIIFCSDEILFFTSLLFLYEPYLQNPINDGFQFGDKMVYPYTQTIEVARYYMYANTLYEKVYNFWDRIGDLLAVYFPGIFEPSKVYFTTVIDRFPTKYRKSENFLWLDEFRNNNFKQLNDIRKNIVHYELIGTSFRWNHVHNPTDRESVENLVYERQKLPGFFKKHIDLTQIGFEKTIQLIDEIPKKN